MDFAITKMAQNGQIVIPAEMRKDSHFKPATKLLLVHEAGKVTIRRLDNKLMEEIELLEKIKEGEKAYKQGRYTEIDESMTEEEIDGLLMK